MNNPDGGAQALKALAGDWDGRTFVWPVRVYYHHTDAGGVVYHGTYLDFMEAARTELLHALGFDLAELVARHAVLFMVYGLSVDYHKPARLNERLRVTATIAHAGRVRIDFDQRAARGRGARLGAGEGRVRAPPDVQADRAARSAQGEVPEMTVTQDLSILSLILNASWAVQAIMVLLLFVSLMSWYYIFRKMFSIRQTRRQTEDFERSFWSRPDLNALYQSAVNARHRTGALERIFEAGFRDYVKLKTQHVETSDLVDGARRAMRATYQREMDHLESHLAFLASVGSVSPYVGLLGTVWGIMHSFRGLANVAQATLAAVAPGIAEALVATAIGLFAAIPAVVAYNRYSYDIERLSVRFESFMEEFSNILQRQAAR
jgi:biopolymer transport protein TolQ